MIPLITCEIPFNWNVCETVFGVNVLDLDFWVQVNSIEQPIKRNSVGSGNSSHCGTSALNDHLDHCFVVLKHIQKSFLMRKLDVCGNTINIIQHVDHSLRSLVMPVIFCHSSQRVALFYRGSESTSGQWVRNLCGGRGRRRCPHPRCWRSRTSFP